MVTKLGVWDDATGEVTIFDNELFSLSPHAMETQMNRFVFNIPQLKSLILSLYIYIYITGMRNKTNFNATQRIRSISFRSKLWIYAAVTEEATVKTFNMTDLSVKFTASSYTLQLKTTKPYYKPGLPVTGSVRKKCSMNFPITHYSGTNIKY